MTAPVLACRAVAALCRLVARLLLIFARAWAGWGEALLATAAEWERSP